MSKKATHASCLRTLKESGDQLARKTHAELHEDLRKMFDVVVFVTAGKNSGNKTDELLAYAVATVRALQLELASCKWQLERPLVAHVVSVEERLAKLENGD